MARQNGKVKCYSLENHLITYNFRNSKFLWKDISKLLFTIFKCITDESIILHPD